MLSTIRRPESSRDNQLARADVRQQIVDCKNCRLCWLGSGPVPYEGPTPNDVMVLGEAPHRGSDRARRVIHVGKPGVLLTRSLKHAGFNLDELFVCDTVSCWTEGKTPSTAEIRACSNNLKAMVQLCDPKVVLSMGATALKVTADFKRAQLTDVHGRPFRVRAGPFIDRWIFPTFHPAASGKSRKAELAFQSDLALFGDWYRQMSHAGWPEEGVG